MPPTAEQPILGVLLAGGASRRMGGGDKCLRQLGGQPLLQHVIDRIGPQVSALALNANGDPARFAAFDLPIIADTLPSAPNAEPLQGPLAGILAALDWAAAAPTDWPLVATVPSDAPFLPADLVARLARQMSDAEADLACARANGRSQPVIGLWPTRLRDDLRAALANGTRKVDVWTGNHKLVEVEFGDADESGLNPFFNINSREDLAKAETMLAQ